MLNDHVGKAVRENWVDQFWGNFGWINTPFPSGVHNVIRAAAGGSAIVVVGASCSRGTCSRAAGEGPADGPGPGRPGRGTAVCVVIVGATLGELYALMY